METRIMENSLITASKEQVSGELVDGDVIILNMKDGRYYGLDPVGGRIWNLVQQPLSIRQMVSTLMAEYDVDEDRCKTEVYDLLQQLANNGLITIETATDA